MKDNNRLMLAKEKCFQRLQKLIDLQEKLASSKILQEAKQKQGEVTYSSSTNPII